MMTVEVTVMVVVIMVPAVTMKVEAAAAVTTMVVVLVSYRSRSTVYRSALELWSVTADRVRLVVQSPVWRNMLSCSQS